MKKILVVMMGLTLSSLAFAQIAGTKHNLSSSYLSSSGAAVTDLGTTEICVFCHTPHNATTGAAPLWNHTDSTSTFTQYSSANSSTFDATNNGLGPESMACMGCHDGTVGIGNLVNPPNSSSGMDTTSFINNVYTSTNALVGTDLTNDHPVGFTYNAALVTLDPELKDPTAAPIAGMLFAGDMECATCHDVHDNTNAPFLRVSNAASALCLTCHIK